MDATPSFLSRIRSPVRRLRFRTWHLMMAVAVAALLLGGAQLARRLFPQPPRPGWPWVRLTSYMDDDDPDDRIHDIYYDSDEIRSGLRHPRILRITYRSRRRGPLTWADSITEEIVRPTQGSTSAPEPSTTRLPTRDHRPEPARTIP